MCVSHIKVIKSFQRPFFLELDWVWFATYKWKIITEQQAVEYENNCIVVLQLHTATDGERCKPALLAAKRKHTFTELLK